MLVTILIVLLIVALIGGLPNVSGQAWGYGPSGLLGVVLIVLVVLLLTGRL